MKDNARKVTKIIDELVYYLLRYHCDNIHVEIGKEESYYHVLITGNYDVEHMSRIYDIEKMLERGARDKSIEAEFWELMGLNSSSFDSELQLIGMMVDEASVEIEGESFRIDIKKHR